MGGLTRALLLVASAAVAVSCGGGDGARSVPLVRAAPPAPTTTAPATGPAPVATEPPAPPVTAAAPPVRSAPPTTVAPPAPAPAGPAGTVVVPYRIEVRSADPAVAAFPAEAAATLDDERGWRRAAFRFEQRHDAPYLLTIAEPDDAQELCRPYDVYRRYSCQNGPVVVINAERWREATPQWTGDLATYRQMLVNHEMGHLLGMRHPKPQCPRPGAPAPVMAQQSTELGRCLPNPWPLPDEIERAARHDLPLAPPPDR